MVARRVHGENHQLSIGAAWRLAQVLYQDRPLLYKDRNDVLEAEALIVGAVKASRRVLGPLHPETIRYIDQLANVRDILAQLETL